MKPGEIFEAFRAKIEAGPTLRPGKIINMPYFYNSQAHDNTFLDKKINEIKIENKYFLHENNSSILTEQSNSSANF